MHTVKPHPPFAMWGVGLSRGLSLSCPHHLRQPGYLPPGEVHGLCAPPRGGFAFIVSPERQSAR